MGKVQGPIMMISIITQKEMMKTNEDNLHSIKLKMKKES